MLEDAFQLVAEAEPYDYQRRIAEEGLPEVLAVPTGAGKTLAMVMGWLWRRRLHPDPSTRASTPHWLVLCLPMRVLTTQTAAVARHAVERLGLGAGVGVHVLMGGEDTSAALRSEPGRDAIVVGTLDMLLSRCLNRGYALSRFAWPVDFALFNTDCHWVFDEVQLMGPALETSRQLDGLRRHMGTVFPSTATWMSATVPGDRLSTVDNPFGGAASGLSPADEAGPLAKRLGATKTIRHVVLPPKADKARARALAAALLGAHRQGTLSLAVHNTVAAARESYEALIAARPGAEVVLLHSRFRPDDRRAAEERALEAPLPAGGRIVVTTQVLEAGVDVSADVVFTEAAPWPSIVQRAGRCNRDGLANDAVLLWAEPVKALPYEQADVDAAAAALAAVEGSEQTVMSLRQRDVLVTEPVHAVLRRVDLIGLFDTTPDLSGNDIDISPYLRPATDRDVSVAWREIDDGGAPAGDDPPQPRELCPAPIAEVRVMVKEGTPAWVQDHLERRADRRWIRVDDSRMLRPGTVIVLPCDRGGYTPTTGWDPSCTEVVEPLDAGPAMLGQEEFDEDLADLTPTDDVTGDDRLSAIGAWYPLADHLGDVEREVRVLADELALASSSLEGPLIDAAALAGRLHDIGKVHPVFQDTMCRTLAPDEGDPPGPGPWAKSGGCLSVRHTRRGFRHELASALALLDPGGGACVLDSHGDADLVRYLVAAHHGRVRVGIRSLPDERRPADAPDWIPKDAAVALGVVDGEILPPAPLPEGQLVPASVLRLDLMLLGGGGDGPSWTGRVLGLRDRPDLGIFRLAFLETLVRLADWRASAAARGEG